MQGEADEMEVTVDYLADYFIGFLHRGHTQPTYHDVRVWCEVSGIEFSPWEFETLTQMFSEFNHMHHKAKAADCPSPLKSESDAMAQKNEAIKKALARMAKADSKNKKK